MTLRDSWKHSSIDSPPTIKPLLTRISTFNTHFHNLQCEIKTSQQVLNQLFISMNSQQTNQCYLQIQHLSRINLVCFVDIQSIKSTTHVVNLCSWSIS